MPDKGLQWQESWHLLWCGGPLGFRGAQKASPDFISCLHTTSHSSQQSRFLPSFCPFCKRSYLTVKSIPGPTTDLFPSVEKLSLCLLTWTVYCNVIEWLQLFPSSKEMSSICDTTAVKFALPCSYLLVAVCNWWSAVVRESGGERSPYVATSWDLVNEMKSLSMRLWDVLVQIPPSSLAGECRKEGEETSLVNSNKCISEQMTRGKCKNLQ